METFVASHVDWEVSRCSFLSHSLASSVFSECFHHLLLSHIKRCYLSWSNTPALFKTSPTHARVHIQIYTNIHSHPDTFFENFLKTQVSLLLDSGILYLKKVLEGGVLITSLDWELPDIMDYKCAQKSECSGICEYHSDEDEADSDTT